MKTRLLAAAALLTIAPGAALADSRTYTAIYSPELDVVTRSCVILSTGVQGQVLGSELDNLNIRTESSNTSIMRTIGAAPNTAQSNAGIRFELVGASVLKLEEADITDKDGNNVPYSGDIELKVPRAKVGMRNSTGDDVEERLGIKSPTNDNTVAKISFKNGIVKNQGLDSGSVVVGKKTNLEGDQENVLRALANERVSGNRVGTIEFTLRETNDINETVVMSATISCEPVPVARTGEGIILPIF